MNTEIHYIIYKITNTLNGMIYIGKHKTSNINDQYMGSGLWLKREQKRLGIENFNKEILFECSSEEEMNKKEAELVNEEFVKREDTYNKILGGGVGGCSEFSRIGGKALSEKMKCDQNLREQYSEKQRQISIRNWNNPQVRQKRIEREKEYWKTHTPPGLGKKGQLCHNYGKIRIFNDETQECKQIDKTDKIPDGWRRGFRPLPYGIKSLSELKEIFDYFTENGWEDTMKQFPTLSCSYSDIKRLYNRYFVVYN